MSLLRIVVVLIGMVLLVSCGGDGGSDADGTTTTMVAEDDLAANGSEVEADGSVATDDSVAGELAPVSGCYVTATEVDLTPVWAGQAPGLAVIVSRDDEVIFTTQSAPSDASGAGAFSDVDVELGTAYRYSVETIDAEGERSEAVPCGSGQLLAQRSDVACGVRVSDGGLPEVSWSGVLLVQSVEVIRNGTSVGTDVESPFVDTGAPIGAASSYTIVVADSTGQGREEQTIDCGEAAPNVAEAGGTLDLAGAIEAANNFPSPYQYVRLEPICPGCPDVAELYLVPSPGDPTVHVVDQAWYDGAPSNERDVLWMIDPLDVATALDEAQRTGSQVVYDIDFDTGLIRSWTIDGVGATYQCLEVDTAPLEMRTRECAASIFND